MDERQLILEIVNCDDYAKACGDISHPCSNTVNSSIFQDRRLAPEAWRFHDCRSLGEVECIFLGWNSGIGRDCSAPSYHDDDKKKIDYSYKSLQDSYITNYRNVLNALIRKSLPYVKTNLAHCKTEHKKYCSQECIEHCADKYLKETLSLCRKLKLIVAYDGIEYLNNRFELSLSLGNRYDKIGSVWIVYVERAPQGGHLKIPKFRIEGLDC